MVALIPKPPMSPPLDPSEKQLVAIMRRRIGKPITVDQFLKSLKADPQIGDNRAAVISTICRIEERGTCQYQRVGEWPDAKAAWFIPAPKVDVDVIPTR